jgi:hypothetical protein
LHTGDQKLASAVHNRHEAVNAVTEQWHHRNNKTTKNWLEDYAIICDALMTTQILSQEGTLYSQISTSVCI